MLPRCLPKRQIGSLSGSKTKQTWDPNWPSTWKDSRTRRIYLIPWWSEREVEMCFEIATSSSAAFVSSMPQFAILSVTYLVLCHGHL